MVAALIVGSLSRSSMPGFLFYGCPTCLVSVACLEHLRPERSARPTRARGFEDGTGTRHRKRSFGWP